MQTSSGNDGDDYDVVGRIMLYVDIDVMETKRVFYWEISYRNLLTHLSKILIKFLNSLNLLTEIPNKLSSRNENAWRIRMDKLPNIQTSSL